MDDRRGTAYWCLARGVTKKMVFKQKGQEFKCFKREFIKQV